MELLSEVQAMGLTKEGTPFDIGGQWKFGDFAKWCQHYDSEKREMFNGISRKRPRSVVAKTEYVTIAASVVGSSPVAVAKSEPMNDSSTTHKQGEDPKAKRRLLNLIHSRRKRERRRLEFEKLQAEAGKLMSEDHNLRDENKNLLVLLSQAKSIIGTLDE
mmetsp:Transcript_2042/g.5653  ORF Transcript_2042/g.5653 Transcript_2042/m.5653 type:complete len:160 (+) Transcript_2042:2093-2572(+)